MTEQSFTTELLKWAKTYGWRSFHVRNSGHAGITTVQGDKGFPDLVLVKPPRLIFAELKVGRGKPSPQQTEWLRDLQLTHTHGQVATAIETHVWRPENWSEILVVLAR